MNDATLIKTLWPVIRSTLITLKEAVQEDRLKVSFSEKRLSYTYVTKNERPYEGSFELPIFADENKRIISTDAR